MRRVTGTLCRWILHVVNFLPRMTLMDTNSGGNMKSGDTVKWVVTRKAGKGFRMSQLEGVIVEIDNDIATVKQRNGHKKEIHITRLRPFNVPGELTELLFGGEDASA